MPAVTFEPLRWQDAPTRVTISTHNAHPRVFYQVTAPQQIAAMVIGRPVEELPRLVAILGPAHHLAAARALDRLFGVNPPPPAENMRQGLLQAVIFTAHLQKIFFLLSAGSDPFAGLPRVAGAPQQASATHGLMDEIMHTLALVQEAAVVLGGRSSHPITAIAGGVSRYLKEEQTLRLTEIAETCVPAAVRIVAAVRDTILNTGAAQAPFDHDALGPMAYLTLAAPTAEQSQETVRLQAPNGETVDRFEVRQLLEKIDFRQEPWTYAPFAFIKDQGWPGLQSEQRPGLYFVGPLARLNGGQALGTPLADQERERLIAGRGPFPHFDVVAAFWVLLVELLQSAENMRTLYQKENFLGPSIRSVPVEMGREGQAALESPQGLIYHHFRVNPDGIVEAFEVLEPVAENNALRCLVSQKTVENALRQKQHWKEIKARLELNLLPF